MIMWLTGNSVVFLVEDELMREAIRLEQMYYSEKSWRTRSSQIRRYEKFCYIQEVMPFPLKRDILRKYIAYLCKDLAYSSIQQYISAILVLAKMLGHQEETRETLGLQWILGGVRRFKGDFVNPATGIFPEDLLKIKGFLDLSIPEDLGFWVCCLIMFRTLLRGSNVLDSDFCILREDVEFFDWGVVFKVYRTKTIQFKERILSIPVAEVVGHPLCLVAVLKQLMRLNGGKVKAPLVGWLAGKVYKPAKYAWFVKKLKKTCSLFGKSGKLGTHSFRHGGAVTLAMLGVSLPEIQTRGDWKSLCVLRYLNRPFKNLVCEEKKWSKGLLDFIVT